MSTLYVLIFILLSLALLALAAFAGWFSYQIGRNAGFRASKTWFFLVVAEELVAVDQGHLDIEISQSSRWGKSSS